MMPNTDELLRQMSELPMKVRAEIAHEILVLLDEKRDPNRVSEPRASYGEFEMKQVPDFIEKIRSVSVDEQEFIVRELLWQISENGPCRYESEEALEAELKRRIESIEDGTAVCIPAEEVFAKLREKNGWSQ